VGQVPLERIHQQWISSDTNHHSHQLDVTVSPTGTKRMSLNANELIHREYNECARAKGGINVTSSPVFRAHK
jgi:hypothetical protein